MVTSWENLPLILRVGDLRRLGFSRDEAYRLAKKLGKKVKEKTFLIPREALRRWLEQNDA